MHTCTWIHTHTDTNTHTYTHKYTSVLTIQNFIYIQLQWTTNRDLRQRKTAVQNGKHCVSIVLEKELPWGLIWRHPARLSVREEGEGHSMWRSQTEKVPPNSGEYGTRNLEAESIRSRAESMGHPCKTEDSQWDKTEQCTFCIYNRHCQTQTKWSKTKQACTNDASVCRTDQLTDLQFSWDTRRCCNAKANDVKTESVKPVNNINTNCLAYLWSISFLPCSAKANDEIQLATLQM